MCRLDKRLHSHATARPYLQVADALQQPFADDSFDLVWSLESGEHMPDKPQFVGELARVCAPGGRVIIVTWCHRVLAPSEAQLSADEQSLLDRICEAYYLPAWCRCGRDAVALQSMLLAAMRMWLSCSTESLCCCLGYTSAPSPTKKTRRPPTNKTALPTINGCLKNRAFQISALPTGARRCRHFGARSFALR